MPRDNVTANGRNNEEKDVEIKVVINHKET